MHRYQKKKNCNYDHNKKFSAIDYCWSYAEKKELGMTDEQIEKEVCPTCEFFKGGKNAIK